MSAPGDFKKIGTGTEPIRLQAPLLLFLLVCHREHYEILRIIDVFIEKVWHELTFLDFKKTKTGVTRCYTNTRFAANKLRNYGLLKFSQKEAFKTWELSLTGFLVAAALLRSNKLPDDAWRIPRNKKIANFDLHPEIRQAYTGIATYEDFVGRLAEICEPDASVFKTFESVLRKAFALLPRYWETLNNRGVSRAMREHVSREIMQELEKAGINDDFYSELSSCIKINDLLERSSAIDFPRAGVDLGGDLDN